MVAKPDSDKAAQDAIEGRTGPAASGTPETSDRPPSAGPHADPALINPDATPGTGALPSPGGDEDVESTSS